MTWLGYTLDNVSSWAHACGGPGGGRRHRDAGDIVRHVRRRGAHVARSRLEGDGFTIVSIRSRSSVFIPIFSCGLIGGLFHEFRVVSLAILVSAGVRSPRPAAGLALPRRHGRTSRCSLDGVVRGGLPLDARATRGARLCLATRPRARVAWLARRLGRALRRDPKLLPRGPGQIIRRREPSRIFLPGHGRLLQQGQDHRRASRVETVI